jgi:hypothetical protein
MTVGAYLFTFANSRRVQMYPFKFQLPTMTFGWHPPKLLPEKVDTDERTHERTKIPGNGILNSK